MRILIAPDSFKGTLTAAEVCDIAAAALESEIKECEITKLPVADGGEGLCACFEAILPCNKFSACVSGPFGESVDAEYLMLADGTAVIELASCAGLPLVGERKNPLEATTFGVGELVADAASRGAKRILLGLGGSATNDCGMGFAAALGYKFVDANANELKPVGKSLAQIAEIIPPAGRQAIPVAAACDVTNPLFGKNGAAFVFAPQKGANESDVRLLDGGLRNAARIIERDLHAAVADIPGAGAAGGAGAGVVAFLGGTLRSGIDIVLDAVDFDKKIQNADVVITGEGRLDAQSVQGKVVSGVARRAKEAGKRVIIVCGSQGEGAHQILNLGVESIFCATETDKSFDEILKNCKMDLYAAAIRAARSI